MSRMLYDEALRLAGTSKNSRVLAKIANKFSFDIAIVYRLAGNERTPSKYLSIYARTGDRETKISTALNPSTKMRDLIRLEDNSCHFVKSAAKTGIINRKMRKKGIISRLISWLSRVFAKKL